MICEYDEKDGLLKLEDKTIYFSVRENDVFKKLFYSDEIVKYEELDEVLNYGYGFNGYSYIRTIISRLRNKLGESIEIINISGRGYLMKQNYKFFKEVRIWLVNIEK